MLEISVLDELTDACAAVTGRQDAAGLLRGMEEANLFIVALDDDRASYRYHHLVRDVLRAVLHATDRKREIVLQHRTAEWLESTGTHAERPATSSRPDRPTGPSACCRTGWWRICCMIRPRRPRWTSA